MRLPTLLRRSLSPFLAHERRGGPRSGHRGRRPGRLAARGRIGSGEPAAPGPGPPRPDRRRLGVAPLLSRGARRALAARPAFSGVLRGGAASGPAGSGRASGERTPGGRSAGLRRGRALLRLPRRAPRPGLAAGPRAAERGARARSSRPKDGDGLLVQLPPAARDPGQHPLRPPRRSRPAAAAVGPGASCPARPARRLRPAARQQDVRAVFVPLADPPGRSVSRAASTPCSCAEAETAPRGRGEAVLGEAARRRGHARGHGAAPARARRPRRSRPRIGPVPPRRSRSSWPPSARPRAGLAPSPVFIYLANEMRVNGREVPYSLVAALDDDLSGVCPGAPQVDGGAIDAPGSSSTSGRLPTSARGWATGSPSTTTSGTRRAGSRRERRRSPSRRVVPLAGAAADRELVPDYPGITESLHLADWDPPFPVDLKRIRPQDEAYWDR